MIPPLFRTLSRTIDALYGAIVAQARDARFSEPYRGAVRFPQPAAALAVVE